MTEKASDLASSKGKKKCSYSMEFKKQVVVYAKSNSNRSATSHFDAEPKYVRKWKKDFEKLKSTKPNRQRFNGGGRKCTNENLEEDLVHWIYEKRSKMLHVSRKMIMWKAKRQSCYQRFVDVASRGWCEKFMQRHWFVFSRKTATAQKDPLYMVDRIVAYVMQVHRI